MTVADLQRLLTDLARVLETAGASRTPSAEVTALAGHLEKFRDLRLKAFGDLLDRVSLDGAAAPRPSTGGGRRPAAGPTVDAGPVALAAKDLYDKAADPAVTDQTVTDLFARLDALGKDGLVQVATAISLKGMTSKNKGEVKAAICNRIEERRGKRIRSQLVDRPPTPPPVTNPFRPSEPVVPIR